MVLWLLFEMEIDMGPGKNSVVFTIASVTVHRRHLRAAFLDSLSLSLNNGAILYC